MMSSLYSVLSQSISDLNLYLALNHCWDMPVINLVVHPKHDPFMPASWETWELLICGLRNVQFIALKNLSDEIRMGGEKEEDFEIRRSNRKTSNRTIAIYHIDGAGPGKFPPISAIRPFIDEIKSWGFDLVHMSCPARDEFSTCTFRKN